MSPPPPPPRGVDCKTGLFSRLIKTRERGRAKVLLRAEGQTECDTGERRLVYLCFQKPNLTGKTRPFCSLLVGPDYVWLTPCLPLIAVNVSEDFERFLELLGERIELKGWQKYRGGLDVKSKFLRLNCLLKYLS